MNGPNFSIVVVTPNNVYSFELHRSIDGNCGIETCAEERLARLG